MHVFLVHNCGKFTFFRVENMMYGVILEKHQGKMVLGAVKSPKMCVLNANTHQISHILGKNPDLVPIVG